MQRTTRPPITPGIGSADSAIGDARLARLLALSMAICLPFVQVILLLDQPTEARWPVALVVAAMLAIIHARHVLAVGRNRRVPHVALNLGILAILALGFTPFLGPGWSRSAAILGASALLILPFRPAIVVLLGSAAIAAVLSQPDGFSFYSAAYYFFTVLWRAISVYVLASLASTVARLVETRDELRFAVVRSEREQVISGVVSEIGERMRRALLISERAKHADVRLSVSEFRTVAEESRNALQAARRMIAGFRSGSLEVELDAAVRLLNAAGVVATVRNDAELGSRPATPDLHQQIETLVKRLIHDPPLSTIVLEVHRRDSGTGLDVVAKTVTP